MFNKDKLNNFIQFVINYLLMPFVFILLLVLCLIIFATISKAATPSTLLPFYISDSAYDSSSFQFLIDDQINWWGYTVFDFNSYDTVFAYEYEEYGTTFIRFYGFSDSAYTITLNEPYTAFTSSGTVTLNLSSCSRYTITKVPGSYGNYSYGYDYPNNISIGFNDIENYPFVYLNNVLWTPSYNNVDGKIVFTNNAASIIENGAAIVPGPFFIPDYLPGSTAPGNVPPTFTPNNYNWSIPPTFDNSSVLNAIQSVKDTLDWLADNLQNEISNLTSNIGGFFKYIGDTIQYYGNAIIDTLNNAIQTFYNNMKSLVENISNQIEYIIQPLDKDVLSSTLNSTSFVGMKNQFSTFFTTFETAFDISEPNTFTLVINIQNIDTFYNFGCRSPVIIHLDDHFIPIRTALRTFLWILISFGTVFVVECGLSDWLRGENDTK